ncbi:hypothetical protein PENTCL1PPCAC_9352, partial [Pristionchus entomophagus]
TMWPAEPDGLRQQLQQMAERNGGHDPDDLCDPPDQHDNSSESDRAYSVQQLRSAYLERVRAESRAARRYTPTLERRPLEGIPEEDRRSAQPPAQQPQQQQQPLQQYPVSSNGNEVVRQYQQQQLQRHEQYSNQSYPQYEPAPSRNQYSVQPPVSLSLRVDQSSTSRHQEDYPQRLMSPTPLSQQQQQPVQQQYPRPILKQSRPQQQQPQQPQQPQQSNGGYEMRAPSFRDLPEDERRAIMQENLMKSRARPISTTSKAPEVSFNGPFFELQEVNGHGGRRVSMTPSQSAAQQDYEDEMARRERLERSRQMSASEMELDRANRPASVVIWPPLDPRERPRSQSVMARSVTDPERIDEFRRQRELESFHLRREEDSKRRAYEKQLRATEIQQQYLYEQKHGMRSPVPLSGAPVGAATPGDIYHRPPQYSQQLHHQAPPPPPPPMSNGGRYTPSHLSYAEKSYTQQDPHAVPPEDLHIYETRPLSPNMTDGVVSPNGTSWKRTYIVRAPDDVAKNEILTSEDLLARDQFDIDLLKRRSAFVPKIEQPKEITRMGRKWQPPPDQPYVWPQLRQPITVEPDMSPRDFKPGAPEGDEYHWEPVTHDPHFKRERKNFTPDHSPPRHPRKGGGTGPLDEPARRQTKYLVQPSPDGSHRPKPAFKAARNAPQGGFYPHAPNAMKVVKHHSVHDGLLQTQEEIIHEKPSFKVVSGDRIGSRASRRDNHHEDVIHDWEKIYDLPPHSSTLVNKDVPRRVDVGKRLAAFENGIHHDIHRRNSAPASRSASVQPHRLSVRTTAPSQSSRPDSAASSALLSPIPRGDEPKAERVRQRMNSIAAISPTPPSYDRARSYQPPALPPGYKQVDMRSAEPRALSPSSGNTRRLTRSVADQAARLTPNHMAAHHHQQQHQQLQQHQQHQQHHYHSAHNLHQQQDYGSAGSHHNSRQLGQLQQHQRVVSPPPPPPPPPQPATGAAAPSRRSSASSRRHSVVDTRLLSPSSQYL